MKEVEITCPQCGNASKKHYSRVRENVKNGIKTYCSRECWRVSQMNKCGSATERLKARSVENENGCWIWSGSKATRGYGKMRVNGVGTAAHRYSYSVNHGSIPDGMIVCHTCDTPSCVNPDHLFVGTTKDNYDDMIKKGRGYKFLHEGRVGTKNGNCKLSVEKVLLIRESWGVSCKSYREIVKAFGLKSPGHARKIIVREIWAHI